MWWFAVMAICFGWAVWSQVSFKALQPDEVQQNAPVPAAETALASVSPPVLPEAVLTAAQTGPAAAPPPAEPIAETAPVSEPAPLVSPPAVQIAPERLAEALQTELKRLGCYGGRVDNQWGRGSRYAMRKFVRAADLQFNSAEPDAKAVAALRGYGHSRNCAAVSAPAPAEQPGARIAQTAPGQAGNPPAIEDDRSYLPPWARNEPRATEPAASDARRSGKRPRHYPQTREVRFKPVRVAKAKASPAASARVTAVRPLWGETNRPVREVAVKTAKGRKKAVAGVVVRKFTSTLQGWPGN